MKKIAAVALLMIASLFLFSSQPDACVGKKLSIGIPGQDDLLLAELLSIIIGERTGTTVTIRVYDNSTEVYQAVKRGEVGIVIENAGRALEMLGRPKEEDAKRAYDLSREGFRKNFNLVLLEPFGLLSKQGGKTPDCYGPAITTEVMNNFPALPRVINKLSGVLNDGRYLKLIQSVNSGAKPKGVARDFLKTKKLI